MGGGDGIFGETKCYSLSYRGTRSTIQLHLNGGRDMDLFLHGCLVNNLYAEVHSVL